MFDFFHRKPSANELAPPAFQKKNETLKRYAKEYLLNPLAFEYYYNMILDDFRRQGRKLPTRKEEVAKIVATYRKTFENTEASIKSMNNTIIENENNGLSLYKNLSNENFLKLIRNEQRGGKTRRNRKNRRTTRKHKQRKH